MSYNVLQKFPADLRFHIVRRTADLKNLPVEKLPEGAIAYIVDPAGEVTIGETFCDVSATTYYRYSRVVTQFVSELADVDNELCVDTREGKWLAWPACFSCTKPEGADVTVEDFFVSRSAVNFFPVIQVFRQDVAALPSFPNDIILNATITDSSISIGHFGGTDGEGRAQVTIYPSLPLPGS